MSEPDDRGTPADVDAAQGDSDHANPAGAPGRDALEALDTGPAEAGSPSQGEGLSDGALVDMVSDPDHRA